MAEYDDQVNVLNDLEQFDQRFQKSSEQFIKHNKEMQSASKKTLSIFTELGKIAGMMSATTYAPISIADRVSNRSPGQNRGSALLEGIGASHKELFIVDKVSKGISHMGKSMQNAQKESALLEKSIHKTGSAIQKLGNFTQEFAFTSKHVTESSSKWIASNNAIIRSTGRLGGAFGKALLGPVGGTIATITIAYDAFVNTSIAASEKLESTLKQTALAFTALGESAGNASRVKAGIFAEAGYQATGMSRGGYSQIAARGGKAGLTQAEMAQVIQIAQATSETTGTSFNEAMDKMLKELPKALFGATEAQRKDYLAETSFRAGVLPSRGPGFFGAIRKSFEDTGYKFGSFERGAKSVVNQFQSLLVDKKYSTFDNPIREAIAGVLPTGRNVFAEAAASGGRVANFVLGGDFDPTKFKAHDIGTAAVAAPLLPIPAFFGALGGIGDLADRGIEGFQRALSNKDSEESLINKVNTFIGGAATFYTGRNYTDFKLFRNLTESERKVQGFKADSRKASRISRNAQSFAGKALAEIANLDIAIQAAEKHGSVDEINKNVNRLEAEKRRLINEGVATPENLAPLNEAITKGKTSAREVVRAFGRSRIKTGDVKAAKERRTVLQKEYDAAAHIAITQEDLAESIAPGVLGVDSHLPPVSIEKQERELEKQIGGYRTLEKELKVLQKKEGKTHEDKKRIFEIKSKLATKGAFIGKTRKDIKTEVLSTLKKFGEEEEEKVKGYRVDQARILASQLRTQGGLSSEASSQLETLLDPTQGGVTRSQLSRAQSIVTNERERLDTEVSGVRAAYEAGKGKENRERAFMLEIQKAVIGNALSSKTAKEIADRYANDTPDSRESAILALKDVGVKKSLAEFQKQLTIDTISKQYDKRALTSQIGKGLEKGFISGSEAQRYGSAIQAGGVEQQQVQKVLALKKQAFEEEKAFTLEYTRLRLSIIKSHYDEAIKLDRTRLEGADRRDAYKVQGLQAYGQLEDQKVTIDRTIRSVMEGMRQERIGDRDFERSQLAQRMQLMGQNIPVGLQRRWAIQGMREARSDRMRSRVEQRQQDYETVRSQYNTMQVAQDMGLDHTDLAQSESGRQFLTQQYQKILPAATRAGYGRSVQNRLNQIIERSQKYQISQVALQTRERSANLESINKRIEEFEKSPLGAAAGPEQIAERARLYKEKSGILYSQGRTEEGKAAADEYMKLYKQLPAEMQKAFGDKQEAIRLEIKKTNVILEAIRRGGTGQGNRKMDGTLGSSTTTGGMVPKGPGGARHGLSVVPSGSMPGISGLAGREAMGMGSPFRTDGEADALINQYMREEKSLSEYRKRKANEYTEELREKERGDLEGYGVSMGPISDRDVGIAKARGALGLSQEKWDKRVSEGADKLRGKYQDQIQLDNETDIGQSYKLRMDYFKKHGEFYQPKEGPEAPPDEYMTPKVSVSPEATISDAAQTFKSAADSLNNMQLTVNVGDSKTVKPAGGAGSY